MEEVWKAVPGWEGLYEVSSLGRVRSLPRYARRRAGRNNNATYLYEGKELLPAITAKGYLSVRLYYDGRQKDYPIHRLVASAFIPNPNNYPQVNHKNEVKTDNSVDNLEWCTNAYNRVYGKGKYRFAVPVKCIAPDGKEIIFLSQADAQKATGVPQANISACCRGLRLTGGGYKWLFL